MKNINITSISQQNVRQCIIDFLQQRLANNNNYKTELNKLAKAEVDNDLDKINEAKQNLADITKRFQLEEWMHDALVKRVSWLMIATHLSKGIHPSSKGANANYNTQLKSVPEYWVCSSTVNDLPYDATGSAAALDIFALLNQKIDDTTLLHLIINDHPALAMAFSDDSEKSAVYLANLKKLLKDNWDNPRSSEINKQFFWPNHDEIYLSGQQNHYRLLMPLHPSSLCHVVFQKVQQRFSEQNKLAREQRDNKIFESQSYFSLYNLAVVKLGGSNAQNASQLIGSQKGRNFLLPSLPPKIGADRPLRITKEQITIFTDNLKYRCRQGFEQLFEVILAPESTKAVRDKRKQHAFDHILAELLNVAVQIQTTFPVGWSRKYQLDMNQKFWLDPNRAKIEGEDQFARQFERGDWILAVEKQFALWINAILKKQFNNIAHHFDDAEITEWQREFSSVVKSSQRLKEGIF